MKNLDRPSSVFFILFSMTICLTALKLSFGTLENPGPRIFPLLLGLSLLIFSIVLFIKSEPSSQFSFSGLFSKGEVLKVIYLLGTFFLSILIFEPMGFVVSIFVLLVLLFKGIGGKTVVRSIFYSSIISLSAYLFFTRLLGVLLPRGILWFL